MHGHAVRNLEKGIEFSGGSLGLGVSYGIGAALALLKQGLKSRVYIIVGDGECDEGIVWEALMAASHFCLHNLTIIIDNNKLQSDGLVKDVMNLGNLLDKFHSFGFNVQEIDGHNIKEICNACKICSENGGWGGVNI